MNKLLVLLAGLLIAGNALGQTVPTDAARLSWSVPTARVDGTPLPSNEIQGYELFWSTTANFTTTTTGVNRLIVGSVTQHTISDMAPATWYFAVRTLSTDGLVSALSTRVSKTTTLPPPVEPQPPTNIEIQ